MTRDRSVSRMRWLLRLLVRDPLHHPVKITFPRRRFQPSAVLFIFLEFNLYMFHRQFVRDLARIML